MPLGIDSALRRAVLLCGVTLVVGCSSAGPGDDAGTTRDAGATREVGPDVDPSPCDDCDDAGASDDAPQPDDAPEPDAALPDGDVPDASGAGPLQIYLAPDGDDARDGLSPAAAVLTLSRAQAIVAAVHPDRDVEVRIALGTYYAQHVSWSYTMPSHTIRFLPADGGTTRPVFDGCTSAGACNGGTWLRITHANGEATNLDFEYLHIQRYGTAMSFDGNRDVPGDSNGHNRVAHCYFDRIGNVFNHALGASTAALRMVNSDDNTIVDNDFVNVVDYDNPALIHSIYAASMSDGNDIENNRFTANSGDAVRIRDYSNNNVINGNTFSRAGGGGGAGYTDWYCDHAARTDCTKPTPECPSWDNQFRNNVLDGNWDCDALATFRYYQDDSTAGCHPPTATSVRLHTSGNTATARPCSMQ